MSKKLQQIAAMIAVLTVTAFANADRVELNIVASKRASLGAAQEWIQALSSFRSARVRSDSSTGSSSPESKWVGSTLYVTAVIGSDNKLYLPGKRFTIRQTKQLSGWIETQKNQKETGPFEAKDDRFGLSPTELQSVHDILKATVRISTKEKAASDVLRSIVRTHSLPLKMSGGEFKRLAGKKLAADWQGYSVGTVVAALLRPHELVMVPSVEGGRTTLRVVREQSAKESWPVGWKSKLKKDELVPKLFDSVPIEIYDTPVTEVMQALEARLETPILFDDGLFAAVNVDPATTKVTVKPRKTFYGRLIRETLFKVKMDSEVRVDENGKPFFWVSPSVKPKRGK